MNEAGKEFLGRGWSFPLQITPDLGQVSAVAYEEDIKQSIYIILSTAKGERVMRPDFGCGIHDLVFDAITVSLVTDIQNSVTDALREFEARIDVLKVDVDTSQAAEGRLIINLDYRNRTTNQRDNFVYPFYFKEAF